jgi:uncharacterized protein
MTFIGREHELKALEDRYLSPKAELFVLYGRRRVGKTELLRQFGKDKPMIYYAASQTESRENLDQLTLRCQNILRDKRFSNTVFRNIEGILEELADKAGGLKLTKNKKLILVLDEFQYWVNDDQSIPSLIQRFWDHRGQYANLLIILCGSSISLMVDYALAEKSPLYGRRTGQLQLKPFDYRTAGKFFKKWSAQDKLLAYGALGGIPAYLKQFDPSVSFQENIIVQLLQKDTFLGEESEFLLKTELRDIKSYTSILKAIAAGNTTLKDITSKLNQSATNINSYLSNLQTLHLVVREVSLSEPAPEKSKKGRYYIQDPFLNFWFRFVEPYTTLVELHQGKELYKQVIEPQLATYMGQIFELICQQYVLHYGREINLPLPKRVGRIWHKDFDLDVVSENIDKSYTVGECEWSASPVNTSLCFPLKDRFKQLNFSDRNVNFLLFSATGFKKTKPQSTECRLIDAKTLFGDH